MPALASLFAEGDASVGELRFSLLSLREKIMALVPRTRAVRLETDHEALLEAQGLAARPGPRQRIDRKIGAAIAEAVKACRILEVEYQSRGEAAPRIRRLAPYGLLTGLRQYLVARPAEARSGPFRLYVVEKISAAKVSAEALRARSGLQSSGGHTGRHGLALDFLLWIADSSPALKRKLRNHSLYDVTDSKEQKGNGLAYRLSS